MALDVWQRAVEAMRKAGFWFARRSTRSQANLHPERAYRVAAVGDEISVIDPTGRVSRMDLNQLSSVIVETNDSGPWGIDVWYIMIGANGEARCAFPMGATNESVALDRLFKLEGFELRGMDSVENMRHLCWQRPSS